MISPLDNMVCTMSDPTLVFGPVSRVVNQMSQDPAADFSIFSTTYNCTILFLIVLFCLVVRNNWSIVAGNIASVFGSARLNRSDLKVHNIQKSYVDFWLILLGVICASFFIVRYIVINDIPILSTVSCSRLPWLVPLALLLGVSAVAAIEAAMLLITGILTLNFDVCLALLSLKRTLFAITQFVVFPFMIGFLLTEGMIAKIMIVLSVVASLFCVFVFLRATFSFFRTHRISIFLWFLYLCTLEIFPVSLLLAPFCRHHACM